MEEKKLTDEEIIKALWCIEGQYISYIDDDDDKCKLLFVDDVLDLIHRLQKNNANQVRMRCDMQRKFDDLQTLCTEQKAEIERLTIAEKQYLSEIERLNKSCGLFDIKLQEQIKETYDYVHKADKLKKRNAELQKQVDELKARDMGEMRDLFNAETDRLIEKAHQQAVKDTAKEILTDLSEYYLEALDNTDCAARFDFWCKKYGVEVE